MNTHNDWNPAHVDLMTLPEIAQHFGVPIALLGIMERHDRAFPAWRRNARGDRVWRLPDMVEYMDGQRK